LDSTDLREGCDYNQYILDTPDGAKSYDPRFGMDDLFNDGAQGQFTVKFLFQKVKAYGQTRDRGHTPSRVFFFELRSPGRPHRQNSGQLLSSADLDTSK
jgi:hypothetical protein